MPRTYTQKDIKLLWGLAAARCSFQTCRHLLVQEANLLDPVALVGKIAHIVAHSSRGPRADPSYPAEMRDKYPNLILLCPTHHDQVDVQPNTYTLGDLKQWKKDHEEWVRTSLALEMPNVGFAELEVVLRAIVNDPDTPTDDLTVISPHEKMQRNGLSGYVGTLLHMGLAKTREVSELLGDLAEIDIDFPERLKKGFVDEYRRLVGEGISGNDLFDRLRVFAASGLPDFKYQAAGLAVLSYLFETCEVFER